MIKRTPFALVLVFVFCSQLFAQVQLHVSTDGLKNNPGTSESPLPSVIEARDRIRQLRENGELENVSVEVLIHAGHYQLPATFELTAEDSGSPEFPIAYKSVDGDVVISGGIKIDQWQELNQPELHSRLPDAAKGKVVCVNLHSLGIDAGKIQATRLHQPMENAPMELYSSQKRLPRAGWPNVGWALTKIGSTPSEVSANRSWILDRKLDPQDETNVWAHGFWSHDWSDSFEPITVNSTQNSAQLSSTDANSPAKIRDGARFRLTNLLSELDMPGEWFADETTGLLLYWPLNDSTDNAVTIPTLDTVLSVYDVENVVFSGIRFESARSMCIEIVGGCDVRLDGCHISQAGNVAVHVFRGARHQIVNCDISCTGSSAIRLEGGDRSTLTSGEHLIEDCHVHDFCLQYLAGRPAIAVYGVGSTIRKNLIHSGPDSAICLFGNEHLVEHNQINHVCREADDSAAIHLSHDPTYRGNVIRKNYIHDLGGFSKTGVFGIYLDDFASGTAVNDNYLRNTVRGIAIGGGRDNHVEGNVIHDALASIQMDARGTTWAKHHVTGDNSRIHQLCRQTIADHPIFAERYPALVEMLADEPSTPKGNVIKSNSFNSRIGIDLHGVDSSWVAVENNVRKSLNEVANGSAETTETILSRLGVDCLRKDNREPVFRPHGNIETDVAAVANF